MWGWARDWRKRLLGRRALERLEEEYAEVVTQAAKQAEYERLLVDIVKHFESFFPEPYKDPVGILTVGYGHVVKGGEPPFPWTEPQASDILLSELRATYEPQARRAWDGRTDAAWRKEKWDDLPAHVQAALVSAAYNAGSAIVASGSWAKRATDAEAGEAFYQWSTARKPDGTRVRLPGLVRRRFSEWKLATQGVVDTDPEGWKAWHDAHKEG